MKKRQIVFLDKRIKEVKNPRLIETGYRSPQLTLWTLGPDEWQLFLKLPDYAARKKPQKKPDVIQIPLLDPDENQGQEAFSSFHCHAFFHPTVPYVFF